ncbi:hypothetical protein [Sulfobacillus thermosulfidooxidans]|uniref:hypothetical protein n=1 Tax=Sulfobacillus thermosulfidooxidans TaxID=28034 RepID=UPI0006B53075|nr:hypothetical protein [Sulfobacillus thermosulfidooxidans]
MNRALPECMAGVIVAKDRRRQALAALPYEEKLRILLRLQRMADAIRQTRGLPPRAWPLDDETLLPLSPDPRSESGIHKP